MSICTQCGYRINGQSVRCPKCGALLDESSPTPPPLPPNHDDSANANSCPACGYPLCTGMIICPACGKQVGSIAPTTIPIEPIANNDPSSIASTVNDYTRFQHVGYKDGNPILDLEVGKIRYSQYSKKRLLYPRIKGSEPFLSFDGIETAKSAYDVFGYKQTGWKLLNNGGYQVYRPVSTSELKDGDIVISGNQIINISIEDTSTWT